MAVALLANPLIFRIGSTVAVALARASLATSQEATKAIMRRAALDIAKAGFSAAWQAAIVAKFYPRGETIEKQIYVNSTIPLASVFEEGAVIRGRPLLWVPFSSTPAKIGRERTTPKLWIKRYGPLVYIPGRVPILAQKIGDRLVPRFFGTESVTIPKKFHIAQIVKEVAAEMPDMHDHYFQRESD